MGFIRSIDIEKINKLSGYDAELFNRLKSDVQAGEVFPAVRKGELYFYYKGGCLYKFNVSSFARNKKYEKYIENTNGLPPYEKAKKQVENKFMKENGVAKERQLLDRLNMHTFCKGRKTYAVVLDIKIQLNGVVSGSKKCDMVLLSLEILKQESDEDRPRTTTEIIQKL